MVLHARDRTLLSRTIITVADAIAWVGGRSAGLRAIMVGTAGIAVAALWLTNGPMSIVTAAGVLLIVVAAGAWIVGQRQISVDPRLAASLMAAGHAIAVFVLGTLAAALTISLAIAFAVTEDAPAPTKQLADAFSGLITAFVSYVLIKPFDESPVAAPELIAAAFRSRYLKDPRVIAGSRLEKAIYSDGWSGITGWAFTARRRRTQIMEEELSAMAPPS